MATINAVGNGLAGATGTGNFVGSAGPTLTGTPTLTLTNGTGLPLSTGVTGQLPLANGGTGANVSSVNSAVMVSDSTGVPAFSSTMINGQVIIGSTGATPTAGTITAGTNITVTNSAGGITIAAAGGASWTVVTGSTQLMVAGAQYIANNASGLLTFTLPATYAVGATFAIQGYSSSGWQLNTNSGGFIVMMANGAAGTSVASASRYDSIYLVVGQANVIVMVTNCLTPGFTFT